jgi:multidrug efflux pump subunit AcrA (membrane-fusion protein)
MSFPRLCALLIVIGLLESGCGRNPSASTDATQGSNPVSNSPQSEPTVELSQDQLSSVKIAPVGTYSFSVEKKGIGTIDFDNKLYFNSDLSTQVFPPAEGTITKTYVELGDDVQKDQPLYSIENQGSASDVRSPITGQITSINAPLGLLVQPGKAPAPCAVADVSTKWVLGNVSEVDGPLVHAGQPVEVQVMAYPDRVFEGKVSRIYATIDPNTHRVVVRCEIGDHKNELRSGMLATFTVRVQDAVESTAMPANGVVHEGDGTLTAWVTTDRQHFVQRSIKVGLQKDGMYQVLDGLQRGELVVTDGAVFLSNMLEAPPSD